MDFNKFKDNVGVEQIIVHLLNDNIKLQAELKTLKDFLEILSSQIDPNYNPENAQKMRDAVLLLNEQEIIASHPLYSDYMKNQLKGLEGLGSDFSG